jgi:hypothetical protein
MRPRDCGRHPRKGRHHRGCVRLPSGDPRFALEKCDVVGNSRCRYETHATLRDGPKATRAGHRRSPMPRVLKGAPAARPRFAAQTLDADLPGKTSAPIRRTGSCGAEAVDDPPSPALDSRWLTGLPGLAIGLRWPDSGRTRSRSIGDHCASLSSIPAGQLVHEPVVASADLYGSESGRMPGQACRNRGSPRR